MSVEDDDNNTDDKHKANEDRCDLHTVNIHLELILFRAH